MSRTSAVRAAAGQRHAGARVHRHRQAEQGNRVLHLRSRLHATAASTGARSPTSTATPACCCIAAIRSSSWPSIQLPRGRVPADATASCRSRRSSPRSSIEVTHHTMMHEALKNFLHGFHHDAHPMAMLAGVGRLRCRRSTTTRSTSRIRAAPPRRDPPDREDADDRRGLLSLFDRLADPLSAQQPRVRRPLPAHDVRGAERAVGAQPGRRQGARSAVHPARRPRAERVDLDRAPGRFHRRESLCLRRRRRRRAVGPGAWRRQRSGAEDADRDRQAGQRRSGGRARPRTRNPASA